MGFPSPLPYIEEADLEQFRKNLEELKPPEEVEEALSEDDD